ncbi:OsmC family protein [Zeaxanthinibacter enoshimensis]|uniref:Putative OsmC-like protein n=1 Tax=Zeaxanthinibacter enoshimensis TaxID=392009 RepID=A0A4V3D3R0_9FLAO|nr:OsmC family protein [Zeaxanthinibacter enoshimensis]TDQ30963.1 putative OsmC-like protein [Zeaxanthinibacter enoshimensis]
MTSKVTYLGELRTKAEHIASGNEIISDAPVDNHGLGQAFSPTDTVATALASCMLTVMGIKSNTLDVSLQGAVAEVVKHMSADPRMISRVEVTLHLPSRVSEKDRAILERTGKTCPVLLSLHPDVKKDIRFLWEQE